MINQSESIEDNPKTTNDLSEQGKSRRRFVFGGVVGGVTALAVASGKLASHSQQVYDVTRFLTGREMPHPNYMPPNPENLLPREISDVVYDQLHLTERYPKTLNKDAFYAVSQRISRLASCYFRPDKTQDAKTQEIAFYKFNEDFFQKMLYYSDYLEVDFVATLLMWQVSGASTSSIRAFKKDIRDERIRVGSTIARDLFDQASGPLIVDSLRTAFSILDVDLYSKYYAMPRIEGPVTLGIHDIEIIMICRDLEDLKTSMPDCYQKVAEFLQKLSPRFLEKYPAYIDLYTHFETLSDKIADKIRSSEEIQQYLRQYYTPEKIREILTDGNRVDAYQFMRTTTYWAIISELSQTIPVSSYETSPEVLEKLALNKTIDYYMAADDPTAFFLDQMTNPKIIAQLQKDASTGNAMAKDLLERSKTLEKVSDQIIDTDRNIAAILIADDKTEMDVDFQLITGIAYSRWLLRDAYKHTHNGQSPRQVIFNDPNSVAYHAFLGTANRESGPSYQLAGSRPLTRATLTFLPLDTTYQLIDNFISNAYHHLEPKHPMTDFKTFARNFLKLIEERYFPSMFGTHRYLLDDDVKVKEFIRRSEELGAYQSFITPPHCSLLRCPEATCGYIAEMTKE